MAAMAQPAELELGKNQKLKIVVQHCPCFQQINPQEPGKVSCQVSPALTHITLWTSATGIYGAVGDNVIRAAVVIYKKCCVLCWHDVLAG